MIENELTALLSHVNLDVKLYFIFYIVEPVEKFMKTSNLT